MAQILIHKERKKILRTHKAVCFFLVEAEELGGCLGNLVTPDLVNTKLLYLNLIAPSAA